MKTGFAAAVIALCTCAPASAFTIDASFSAVATGGTLSAYFSVPSPYPSPLLLAGHLFDININGATVPNVPFGDPPGRIAGSFDSLSRTVPYGGFVYGFTYPLGPYGGSVTLTDTTFTYAFTGDPQGNNSYGTITLTADRVNGGLTNWRGTLRGGGEPQGNSPFVPYYYDYRDMTFVLQAGNVRITELDGIPEPTNWAMMIGGFGLVGGAMRRKRLLAPA